MDFSTTLLREKFIIRDVKTDLSVEPVIALSNRMSFSLFDIRGRVVESFVVRAFSMHTCIRMAAKIVQTYLREGPIMVREESFNFESAWADIIHDYERQFSPQCWVAVYNAGKTIFKASDHHGFLDVIENCENRNNSGSYDTSVFLAEEIFASKGKAVAIEHQADTAMVLDIKPGRARCGLIMRSPVRRTNFNYMAQEQNKQDSPLNATQCLTVAASFLEGIHLAFLIGQANEGLRLHTIARYGEEDKRADAARRRLARLNAEIKSFENNFMVNYRPDRPEFPNVVIEAEKYTKTQWEIAQAENRDE